MIRSTTTLRLFLLLGLLGLAACGGDGTSTPDTSSPTDTRIEDQGDGVTPDITPDVADDVVTPVDQPMVLSFYPPTLCGCDPGVFPPKDCGWFVKEGTVISVRAEHTAGKYVGAAGIYRVRLLYMGDPTAPDGILVAEGKAPDESGMFKLTFKTTAFEDSDTGLVKNGTYAFRILALSKTYGDDGKQMQKSQDLKISLDTAGPKVTLVSPKVQPGTTLRFIESFKTIFVAGDTLAGLEEVHFFMGDVEVEPSVTGLNATTTTMPFTRTLDISTLDTQLEDFRVVAADCIGNQTETTVPVQIIAVPRYEMPKHPLVNEDLTGAIALHLADLDIEDGLDDLLLVTPTAVAVARTTLEGEVKPLTVLATMEGLKDAMLLDVTQDGFPDLVTLTNDGDADLIQVFEHLLNEDGEPTWKFSEAPIYSLSPEGSVTVLRTRDMNVDGSPDLVLGGPNDTYSVAILLHTRKGPEFTEPASYFEAPSVLTGITSLTSIEFGYLDSDAYPDLVIGRGNEPTLSVVINDRYGSYGIAHDTVLCGGGTKLSVVGDFNEDGVDDVLVSGLTAGALYLEAGNGLGYFTPLAPSVGQDDMAFGLQHVANQLTLGLLNDLTRPLGDLLFLGAEPDSMVLANLDEYADKDVAVAIPDSNRIGIYRYEPGSFGQFSEHYSVNPGVRPRALVAGKFNGDGYNDLACIVGDGTLAVVHNHGDEGAGTFSAPLEIPMPVQADWTKGRVVPTQFLARDIDNVPGADLVVLSDDTTQFLGDEENQVQLVLAWLSNGWLPELPAIKSPMNPALGKVTGLDAGKLDSDDSCVDLVLTLDEGGSDGCETRSLEVMRGCRRVADVFEEEELEGANADYFIPQQANIPGHFWSLGGFLGLQKPKGVAVGKLDVDGVDDVVLFASEEGEPENPLDYQPNIVATYLTKYDDQWITTSGGITTCPQKYKQIWFQCAPYWPMQQTSNFFCSGNGEAPKCMPVSGDGTCAPWFGPAKPSDQTAANEVGIDPVKAIVGNFYPDEASCNDILVAWSSGSMSYLKGNCGPKAFKFHTEGLNPNLYAIGESPLDLGASDIDKDGNVDVVAALAENISIMYGKDFGATFQFPVFLVDPNGDVDLKPSAVAVVDVNGDDINDVLVTSKKQNQVAIYVGAGNREFLGPYYLPSGTDPVDLEVVDMDNDGCLDLAVLNAGSSTVTVLRSLRCDNL